MKSPRILSVTVAALFASVSAHAADLTWDTVADGGVITPADGTWDLANPFWNNGTGNVAWTQTSATAALNAAIFGGVDGTYAITLGAALASQSLTFNNSGYTLSATSARTLTLGGSSISIANGKSATIGTNVTLARTGAYTITGGGRLFVSGTMNASTGATEIRDGSTLEVLTGGTVNFSGSPVIGANTTPLVSQHGNMVISGGTVNTIGSGTNFVLGNLKTGTTNAVFTITSGSLNVDSTSADGIRFGSNTPDANAWTVNGTFNLDGGTVTAPQIRRYTTTGLGVINAIFNFNGGTLTANKANTAFINGAITTNVKAGGAKINSNGFDVGIAQNLVDAGGGGGLEKLGAGILTLTGNNTYTGTTTVSGGTLLVLGSTNSGGASIAAGATLQIGNGGTVGGLVSGPIVNNGTLTINRSNAVDLSIGISGNGAVNLTGGGAYTFGGTNTYTGPTNVTAASRVDLTGTYASNINVSGGINVGGEGSTTGSLTFGGAHTLFFDPGTAAHLTAASINASGATITLNPTSGVGGAGILVLEAAGGISGTVGTNFLFAGRGNAHFNGTNTQLLFDATPGLLKWVGNNPTNPTFWDTQITTNWNNAGTPDKFFIGDAVTFDDTASNYFVEVQGASVSPGSITFNNSANAYTITGGAIAGSGSVVKNGTATVIISNNNSFSGGTTINAGTIQLGDGVFGNGTLGTGAVTNNSEIVTNYGSNNATVVNDIGGSGALTQSGTGIVSLTGTNSYSGTTMITAGTLQIGGGGTTGTLGTAAVLNNATLAFNRSDDVTVTNSIVGTGGVTKIGIGTLTLGSSNTYSGVTTVTTGAIRVTANSGVLGDTSNGTVVGAGGAIQLQGGVTVTGELLSLIGDGVNGTTAPGALRNLSGTNEWAGDVTIGTAATTRLVSDAGTLKVSGNISLSPIASDQFVLQGNGSGEISGIIAGASRLTRSVTGNGTWTLSGANTYTGKTTISGGMLRVSSINSVVGGAASSSLGAPTTVANGTIDLGSTTPTTGGLIYTGSGETTDRVINFAATGNGGGILDQSGTGLLKFGSNLGVTAASGTKTLTLQGSTSGTGEFAGNITNGAGTAVIGVTKAGTGTWTLSGANSYTGVTNINAGTLAVAANGSISGSTSINVSGGATFNVSSLPSGFTLGPTQTLTGGAGITAGSVVGNVTADAGAIVAPGLGVGNRGTLSISNGFSMNSGSHLALDLASAVPGTGYDQLIVTGGNVTLAGDTAGSTLTFTPSFTDVFYILLNTGAGTTTGTLGGAPEGGSLFIGAQEFKISYTSDFGGAGFVVGGSGNDVALMAVPEPGSAAALLGGLGVLAGLRRRKRQAVEG